MNAASVTVTAINQRFDDGCQSESVTGSAHRGHRQSERQGAIRVQATVDDDLHRNALHDLDEFPVAFSAGNAEKREPLPYWMLCT